MARQFFVLLLATFLIFISISSTKATDDSPATSFIQKTCNDAKYKNLCLNTLLPNANRINGSPKKAIRLAISAILPQVQSTSDSITNLSQQPQLWTREVKSLKSCVSNVTSLYGGVLNALQVTNHLGGGTKVDKESQRLSMENDVKGVMGAVNTCNTNLQSSRARDNVVNRVAEATEPLVELATNAVNLIHRMQF